MRQLEHHEIDFVQRQFPLSLVLDGVSNLDNIAMLARLSEAFGVRSLVLLNAENVHLSPKLIKKSRHTINKVDLQQLSIDQYLWSYNSVHRIAIEVTDQSIPISDFTYKGDKPIHLIIGGEQGGISQKLLSTCQQSYHIEMFGQNTSLNVATAASIALHQVVNVLRSN